MSDIQQPAEPAEPAELWTVTQVAEYLGYSGNSATGSARKAMHRLGVPVISREPGRGGQNLYDAAHVQAATASRPGKGVGGGRPPRKDAA